MTAFNKIISTDKPVRLVGRWAWITTIYGVVYATTLSIIVILGLPYGFHNVSQVCQTNCLGQLTATNIQDLQRIGISVDAFATFYVGVYVLFVLICLGAGGLILWKKPGEIVPFCAAIFIMALSGVEGGYIFFGDVFSHYPLLARIFSILGMLMQWGAAYLMLTFPNGQFKRKIFFWLFIGMGIAPTLVYLYMIIFTPDVQQDPTTLSLPVAVPLTLLAIIVSFYREKTPIWRRTGKYLFYTLLCMLAILVSIVASVTGLIVYLIALIYRSKTELTPRERNSVKWLIWGGSLFFVLLLTFYLVIPQIPLFFEPGTYYFILFSLLFFFGCGINLTGLLMAVLYANIFDINLVIKRTLVYTALSILIVGIYLGSVVGLQELVSSLTGQHSDLAIVGATLVVALLFQPLRRTIQGFVDRRFYRHKYDAARTVEDFSARLQTETDLKNLTAQLKGVLGDTLQPEQVSIWLKQNPETKKS